MTNGLFTIGHSNHEWVPFIALLWKHEVRVLADVRSKPISMWHPHFSQPEIETGLRDAGIRYLFLGEELGGRPDDPKAYRADGLVDYRARRKSFAFQQGIERVLLEMERESLALMCAEEDPLDCHRFLMICPGLVAAGVQPVHIRGDGELESQVAAEDRLLEATRMGAAASGALFAMDRAAALEDAYLVQAERRAFRVDPQTVDY
jgi:uncharacterized protein (DUF488 family)